MVDRNYLCFAALPLLCALSAGAHAVETQETDARFQSTYVWQTKPAFGAAYSGQNSLGTSRQKSYSFTSTAFLGMRTWRGGEIYFNPEVSQGVPLSSLTGLGGFSNGEIARTSGPTPVFYRARLFLRQTWGLGGSQEMLESEPNQLAGMVASRRLVFTAGNISALDIFDDNAYSHEPRQQFLNWSLYAHGAWDYPADSRGYSWGAALEYITPEWALRAGRFLQPRQSNGMQLNYSIANSYGDAVEVERAYVFAGHAGRVRLLAFRNRANMGGFRDALALAPAGGLPDLAVTRRFRDKRGYGVNVEQALGKTVGAFFRASANSGEAETYAFTEIDRSISGGLMVQGAAWGRSGDTLGLAAVRNGLSSAHRDFLAAGGLGFFLGDGRLNYRPEAIMEAYYNLKLGKRYGLTLDMQRISNPAYNADRGPAKLLGVRLHAEF